MGSALQLLSAQGALRLWSVRFADGAAERAFKRYSVERNGPTDQFILISGLGIHLAYGLLDWFTLGAVAPDTIIIRLVGILLLLPFIAWTFLPSGRPHIMWVAAFQVILIAYSMGMMLAKTGSVSPPYYVGFIHLCLVFSSVIQINFRVCVVLIAINYGIFAVACPIDTSSQDLVAAHFFVIASFLSCAIVNFVVERNRRIEFMEFREKQRYLEQAQRLARDTEDSLSRRNALLNVLGHVVKTPLHQVVGYAQVIQQTANAADDPMSVGEFAEEIVRAGQTLSAQSQRILDYSRADAGLLPISIQTTTPDRVANEVLRNRRREADDKHIVLDTFVCQTPIRTDPRHLSQALDEILSNAVKYCPPGTTVSLTSAAYADHVTIAISDNGPGIPESELSRVSDALNSTHEFRNVGTDRLGIGVSLARILAKVAGGKLYFSSFPDQGCLGQIVIPRAQAVAPEATRRAS